MQHMIILSFFAGILTLVVAPVVVYALTVGPPPWLARLIRWLRERGRVDQNEKLLIYGSSGGTCRDPMAKAITLELLRERAPNVNVQVEGMCLRNEAPPKASTEAIRAIDELYPGKDLLKDHVPKPLTPALLRRADLVLVMNKENIKTLQPRRNERNNIQLFNKFLLDEDADVEDPWRVGAPINPETLARYEAKAKEIQGALMAGFDRILKVLGAGPACSKPTAP